MQSGGLLERPRRGSPASSLRAARPARPCPAWEREATRHGPRPFPCPPPKAWLRRAEGPERARESERGRSGPARPPGTRGREGGANVPGPTEAPLRLPRRGPRARIAEGLSPGRLPCGGNGAETRWPRSRPAAPTRVLLRSSLGPFVPESRPACGSESRRRAVRALWRRCRRRARLPASARAPLRLLLRALREPLWIVKARSVLGTRPGFMLALGSSSAYAGFRPLLSSSQAAVSRLNLTHQRP